MIRNAPWGMQNSSELFTQEITTVALWKCVCLLDCQPVMGFLLTYRTFTVELNATCSSFKCWSFLENSELSLRLFRTSVPIWFRVIWYCLYSAAKLPVLALFSPLAANDLVEVVSKSAEVNFSVSSLCFMKSDYVKYIKASERLKTS